ncbi:hypothetical protein GCM10009789_55470 [Kribbella sancticallisti]|uniref:Copper(I)-binding protein n=1 Tax=Kribbella sancticallisti TaxID=460087 RepID=A0ABP4Q124_9ACTN
MSITSSSQAFRRVALAGATVALSTAVAACGAGFGAQTLQPYQPSEGTNADSGSIGVRNMLVLASEEGKGELHGAIVNSGRADDTLSAIAIAPAEDGTDGAGTGGGGETAVKIENFKPADLKAGTSFTLPPKQGLPVTVTGAKPGQMIRVTLTFGQAGPITTSIPVLTEDHYSPSPRNDGEEAHG